MGKPDAPTPPNPIATGAAQTGTNVSTAIANAFLNNTGQVTPDGSLRYDVTGNYGWTDPSSGNTYQIPTFTSTQSLSPQGEAIKQQTLGAQMNMAGMANAQSGRISGLLSNEMNLSGAPSAGSASSITGLPGAATSFNAGGPIQTSLGDAGAITRSYGAGDFSTDRQNVQDALMARINPQLDIQQNKLQQQLADQGIRYGSDAYNNAFTPFNQQANDARFAAINQAGQEQQRMMDMAAQRAGFENSAQQQAYTQALGAGSFANAAQGQQFGQNASQATFQNAGLAQQLAQQQAGFNASQTARNQYMQEQYATRNQPINEITSLLSGSQVQSPNWLNTPTSQIPTTDIAGIINNNFSQQLGVYQQQNQNYQSLMGGILGLGGKVGSAAVMSDRREKENIDRVGTVFAASVQDVDHDEKKKLPIYQYSYKDDPASTRHIGPMAQDVKKIEPGAVEEHEGIKYIRPQKVMGSILRAS
jgi:hypothetical protein